MCYWCKFGKSPSFIRGIFVHAEGEWAGVRWASLCTNERERRRQLRLAYKRGDIHKYPGIYRRNLTTA